MKNLLNEINLKSETAEEKINDLKIQKQKLSKLNTKRKKMIEKYKINFGIFGKISNNWHICNNISKEKSVPSKWCI